MYPVIKILTLTLTYAALVGCQSTSINQLSKQSQQSINELKASTDQLITASKPYIPKAPDSDFIINYACRGNTVATAYYHNKLLYGISGTPVNTVTLTYLNKVYEFDAAKIAPLWRAYTTVVNTNPPTQLQWFVRGQYAGLRNLKGSAPDTIETKNIINECKQVGDTQEITAAQKLLIHAQTAGSGISKSNVSKASVDKLNTQQQMSTSNSSKSNSKVTNTAALTTTTTTTQTITKTKNKVTLGSLLRSSGMVAQNAPSTNLPNTAVIVDSTSKTITETKSVNTTPVNTTPVNTTKVIKVVVVSPPTPTVPKASKPSDTNKSSTGFMRHFLSPLKNDNTTGVSPPTAMSTPNSNIASTKVSPKTSSKLDTKMGSPTPINRKVLDQEIMINLP